MLDQVSPCKVWITPKSLVKVHKVQDKSRVELPRENEKCEES